MTPAASTVLKAPFQNYEFDHAYDEMFEAPGEPRAHYQALHRTLLELPPDELRKSQQAANLSFLHQGITFTVYGNKEGTERIFPNDLLPRIIPGAEWRKIEQGLTQRITALNLFLKDIYHEGRILADGKVPRELLYSCKHFRREMRGLEVPRTSTSASAERTWFACRTAILPYWKIICASPAAFPTCWPTARC